MHIVSFFNVFWICLHLISIYFKTFTVLFCFIDALKFKEKFEEAGKENKKLAIPSKWSFCILLNIIFLDKLNLLLLVPFMLQGHG